MKKYLSTACFAMLTLPTIAASHRAPLAAPAPIAAPAASTAAQSDTLVVTTTPTMHCAGCENKIKQNIRFVKGTKKIETSVPHQTVTIIYDAKKSSYPDFVTAFRKIGYEIKKVKK